MTIAAVGFAALAGGVGFGVTWAALMKLKDLALWNWIGGAAPAGVQRFDPSFRGLVLASLAELGSVQEKVPWLKSISVRMHAKGARAWLGEEDPGSGAWLAGKELAFLVAACLSAWLLEHWGLGLACGIAGFFVPDLLARDRYERRQKQIRRELPDVLDLLTLSFEAGLSVDAGLKEVSEKYHGRILSGAIARMLGKIRFGARRHQAWRDMATGLGNPELTEVMGTLIQADSMGVGLAEALKGLSQQMRVRRRQQVEEAAHKAPVKLLFPLVFFIFPAIFVVLLGPVVLQMLEVFK